MSQRGPVHLVVWQPTRECVYWVPRLQHFPPDRPGYVVFCTPSPGTSVSSVGSMLVQPPLCRYARRSHSQGASATARDPRAEPQWKEYFVRLRFHPHIVMI